ncbi:MAG: HU family DNA-binding protein [Mailhella sp.]|nr:HU family DNA-binding protein [Mailhella sp.]
MNRALTKADIVETIYNDQELDLNRGEVKSIVEDLLLLMKKAIQKDDALLLSGFGKFEAYGKDARKGRNPQTDEAITLPSRKVVVFRLSRKFRLELNGGEAE